MPDWVFTRTVLLVLIPAGLAIVNAISFFQFYDDKQRARRGEQRIPEASLLQLAMFGGTPGAFLARHLFRHKTRKEPFSTYLQLIAVVQIGLLTGFVLF